MGKSRSWSEAGAARHAREMRATTVQYLRTSPVARLMEESSQHRALATHAQTYDQATAPVMLYGGLGYEPPYPADLGEGADLLLTDEAECLAGGELYVVEPGMADVAAAAALTLTLDDLELLNLDDLPSPTGVLVLPQALLVRNTAGELICGR